MEQREREGERKREGGGVENVYVCVCVCVCERERERGEVVGEESIHSLLHTVPRPENRKCETSVMAHVPIAIQ